MKAARKDCFIVEGGSSIQGTLKPAGNKNEALPAIAATLLAPGLHTLENVPKIRDVSTLLDILQDVGTGVTSGPNESLSINTIELQDRAPSQELGGSIRGSFLLAPGLLYRHGHTRLPRPGGDRIGRRRIDTHVSVLHQLGAEIKTDRGQYLLSLEEGFRATDIFLDEASVMATENAVMAAAVAKGTTRIANAASEPHVQGLCNQLINMGAKIDGVGTNRLEIEGCIHLEAAQHRIGPDHIEIGSFCAIAAMTGGELCVGPIVPDDLRMIRLVLARLGVQTQIAGNELIVPAIQELTIQNDLDDAIPKIDDAPWPGFPSDLTSIAVVLATQARGTILVHEKMFENRLFFVDRLISMGAKVILCDPHRAVVIGPTKLQGCTLASPDIRAGMALVAAALCAEGKSTIMNAGQVDRGYENIDVRLRQLGGNIYRL